MLTPVITLFMWRIHCNMTFDHATTSDHAMTVENYLAVFRSKTGEQIYIVCKEMVKFVLREAEISALLIVLLTISILFRVLPKDKRKELRCFVMMILAVYVLWIMGMLGMYLFSMPVDQAIVLASVERYYKTIVVAILYLTAVVCVKVLSQPVKNKNKDLFAVGMVLGVTLLGTVTLPKHGSTVFHLRHNVSREEISDTLTGFHITPGERWTVLLDEGYHPVVPFICRYLFYSADVEIFTTSYEDVMSEINSGNVLVMQNGRREIIDLNAE